MRKILLRCGAAALILGFLAIHVLDVTAQEASAKKEIRVYVDRQILLAFDGGKQIYRFDVVTGKEGKETVAGTYKIFRKEQKYVSKTYNAEMPYTMFFTSDGKAIHGTLMAPLRSYLKSFGADSIGSQGCVGLTDDNAKVLFEWAPKGTRVVIIHGEEDKD